MRWLVCAVLVLGGCDSFKNVSCDKGCAQYGAVCNPVTNTCQRGLVLDMAVAVEADMAKPASVADMTMTDGPLPPMCTPQTDVADCTDATRPICGAGGMCRACTDSGDDAMCAARSTNTPHCATTGSAAGQCVQCTTATQAADCPTTAPICGSNGTCRGCAAHSECPTLGTWTGGGTIPGICVFDNFSTYTAGSCAPANKVAYVDNLSKAINICSGANVHDGTTPGKAYCDLQDAIAAVANPQPFIVVAGHGSQSYGSSSTTGADANVTASRSVSIVGPGASVLSDLTKTAQLSSGTSLTSCFTTSSTGTVILDGFEIGNTTQSLGIAVNTGATLIARRNYIHSAHNGGVSASNGTIILDGNDIFNNSRTGVALSATKFTMTNNVIASNGSLASDYGVTITGTPAGSVFAFNTVANNHSDTSTSAGVYCMAATTLQDSIVYANTAVGAGSGTQFGGSCMLSNVVTGSDSATGASMAAPALTGVYRLDISTAPNEQKNKACCIDQLTAPGTPFADHDVDFTARPKGAGPKNYDIGASEAE